MEQKGLKAGVIMVKNGQKQSKNQRKQAFLIVFEAKNGILETQKGRF